MDLIAYGFERVDGRAIGRDVGVLVDGPRLGSKTVTGISQSHHTWNEKHEVKNQVQPGLQAGREKAIQYIAAHMAVFGQGVCACHHEERAVHHAHDVKGPRVRAVQHIAGEYLPRDHEGQRHDQPGKKLTDPSADFVHQKKEILHEGTT